jgi:uncharacterized protein (DUF2147 family)
MRISSVSTLGLAAFLAVAALVTPAAAQQSAVGVWATVEGKSHVDIAACGEALCGTIIWLKKPNDDDGQPLKDGRNKEESLRSRPIIGISLISDMQPDGDKEWSDGNIYNPEDGDTYSSSMALVDADTLKVEGCVFVFCKEQIWTRVKN